MTTKKKEEIFWIIFIGTALILSWTSDYLTTGKVHICGRSGSNCSAWDPQALFVFLAFAALLIMVIRILVNLFQRKRK